MSTVRRIYFHTMRFRSEIIYGSIISVIFMGFFGLFYPKDSIEETVEIMISLGLFGNLSKVEAGWGVWVSIMVGLFLYLLVSIVSINIGAKIIPTKQNQGTEFFMGSNPMDPRRFYLENLVAGMFAIIIILIPAYLVILLQTFYFDGLGVLGGITLTFAMFNVVSLFYMTITSMTTTLFFQTGKSKAIGFGYLGYGFIMELLEGNPSIGDVENYSINAYLKLTTLVTLTDYTWNPIFVVTAISIIFLVIGVFMVKSPNYLERATSKERFSIMDATIGRLLHPGTSMAKKYPHVIEQLRKDRLAIVVVALIYTFWIPVFWSTLSSAGDQLAELMAGFDTPTTRALAQGNRIELTLVGFSIMKFFSNHWMFFGIYPMLVAASIPTRDVRSNEHDIIYGSKVKPGKLMDYRLTALLIEVTFLYWFAFLVMSSVNQAQGQEFVNSFIGTEVLFSFFLISWIHYSALFIFITGIAMIPKEISKGRRWGIGAFFITFFLNVIAYLNGGIEFIKYFSILNYYRPVEIVYGDMNMIEGVIQSSLTLIFCIIFYFVAKKYRYEKASIY